MFLIQLGRLVKMVNCDKSELWLSLECQHFSVKAPGCSLGKVIRHSIQNQGLATKSDELSRLVELFPLNNPKTISSHHNKPHLPSDRVSLYRHFHNGPRYFLNIDHFIFLTGRIELKLLQLTDIGRRCQ